jgi:hypothetical protein
MQAAALLSGFVLDSPWSVALGSTLPNTASLKKSLSENFFWYSADNLSNLSSSVAFLMNKEH